MDQFAYYGPQDRRGFAFHGRRVSPQFLFFRTIVSHPDFAPILRLEKGWEIADPTGNGQNSTSLVRSIGLTLLLPESELLRQSNKMLDDEKDCT
jgi:hypothetical protein